MMTFDIGETRYSRAAISPFKRWEKGIKVAGVDDAELAEAVIVGP